VYAIWKGMSYARKYVIPANPKTAAQELIRGYFTAGEDPVEDPERSRRERSRRTVAAYAIEDQATKSLS